MFDKVINAIFLIAFCFSVAILSFSIFAGILFLEFSGFQPVFFLILFLFLGKSQPDVSYKGCSYKKRVTDILIFLSISLD